VVTTPCSIARDLSTDIILICSSAELALGELALDHPAVANLDRIIRSCDEAAARIGQLCQIACSPDDISDLY
jgi:hypothetical protein